MTDDKSKPEKVSETYCAAGPEVAAGERFPTPFFLLVLTAVVSFGAALRLIDLENRPMHCDEAVHGIKFGKLLENDDYIYDPREYHGPALNYLTLPIAHLAEKETLIEVTEIDLRLLPAIFGIALVGLVWLVRGELGSAAALWAAVLTAVSPAMVFYSRYYVQEMLLVAFTFVAIVALWKVTKNKATQQDAAAGSDRSTIRKTKPGLFARLPRTTWLVVLGLCLGMMHTSKETCVIAIFCLAVAVVGQKGIRSCLKQWRQPCFLLPLLLVVLTAASVSALFFSSFFDNPRGIVDSLTTYFVYLGRSSGEGSVGRHVYPWHYYLSHFFWHDPGDGPIWTELSIGLLAVVGLVAGFWGKGIKPVHLPMVRMLGIYTVLMTLIYSVMPYKTPWCALGFLHGMMLLAGVGAAVAVRVVPGFAIKAVAVALLVAAIGHLAWQAHRASFRDCEDPNNPYVYAHTKNDIRPFLQQVRQIAAGNADGRAMHIQVICPDADWWPLPWYLRDFSRIGWFSEKPPAPAAPLIIAQPKMEPVLLTYLYVDPPPGQRPIYMPVPRAEQKVGRWELRPNVFLQIYARYHDLWQNYQDSLAASKD